MANLSSIINCPRMDSVWKLFEKDLSGNYLFPEAKELSSIELTTKFKIPLYVPQSIVHDNKTAEDQEFIDELRRLDIEDKLVPVMVNNVDDDDDDDGPNIFIGKLF